MTIDLRTLRRGDLRRISNFAYRLPDSSRVMRHTRNDVFDQKDHLLATIVDYLRRVDFFTQIAARATVTQDSQSVFENTPEPVVRPNIHPELVPEEDEPKFVFVKGRELAGSLDDGKIVTKNIKKAMRKRLREG